MFASLASNEGSGDNVTSVPTAHFGVTEAAADAVGETFEENMSEEKEQRIATAYANYLEGNFRQRSASWDNLDSATKEAALDAAYNLGESVFGYKGFMGALDTATAPDDILIHTLDTAQTEGKASKGIAIRRAEGYNKAATGAKIAYVEAKQDGTIIYTDASGNVIFKFKSKGGLHNTSIPEKVRVK